MFSQSKLFSRHKYPTATHSKLPMINAQWCQYHSGTKLARHAADTNANVASHASH